MLVSVLPVRNLPITFSANVGDCGPSCSCTRRKTLNAAGAGQPLGCSSRGSPGSRKGKRRTSSVILARSTRACSPPVALGHVRCTDARTRGEEVDIAPPQGLQIPAAAVSCCRFRVIGAAPEDINARTLALGCDIFLPWKIVRGRPPGGGELAGPRPRQLLAEMFARGPVRLRPLVKDHGPTAVPGLLLAAEGTRSAVNEDVE
jgi:hypothetical protein